jgi:lysophospholipase L1-like esterase
MRPLTRYVAIGDSTTEGLEDPDGNGGYRGWANRFAQHMANQFGHIQYANLAIRGRCASEVHSEQLARAQQMNPDVATVVAGVNDLLRPQFHLEEVSGHISKMIHALRSSGTTVLTFTMPDMVRVNPMTRLIRRRLFALNERLRETCRSSGALLLDLAQFKIGGDPRLWHPDRLHANALGHARIGMGLASTLGLPMSCVWHEPLPSQNPPTVFETIQSELAWGKGYLLPWIARHARGESSGDGRVCKRPQLEIIHAE